MGRPHKYRHISGILPKFNSYIPEGADNIDSLMTMYLSAEEFEALKLRHYENLKQTVAAEQMEISQTTYSRIIARAYEKLTKAFIEGYSISFQIPTITVDNPSHASEGREIQKKEKIDNFETQDSPLVNVFSGYGCQTCGYQWEVGNNLLKKEGKISVKIPCPECKGKKTYRLIKKLTPTSNIH